MSVQGDGTPPDQGSFSKATVDRWQVFGGMAGVAGLLLSVVGSIRNLVLFSLVAAGVVTLVGVALLYRWGRRPQQHVARHFALPVVITIVGAATAGVLGGLELRSAGGTAQPDASSSTTTGTTTGARSAADRTTTSTTVPAGASPEQFRSGPVTINFGHAIDLDSTGENGGVTRESSQKSDLVYGGGFTSPHIVIVAETGIETPPSYQDCTNATGLDDYIEGDKVQVGAAFCVKTAEERWAGLVVVDVAWYRTVKFDLVVWDKQA